MFLRSTLLFTVVFFSFQIFAVDQQLSDSNCTAMSDDVQTNGVGFYFNTVPPPESAQQPYAKDFPLKECLTEIRLALVSKLFSPDGTVRLPDHGTVDFGEKGKISTCVYEVKKGQKLSLDVVNRILMYEGISPANGTSFPREELDSLGNAVEGAVEIICQASLSS